MPPAGGGAAVLGLGSTSTLWRKPIARNLSARNLLGDRKSDTPRYERSTLCWRYDSADSSADRATPRQDDVVARK